MKYFKQIKRHDHITRVRTYLLTREEVLEIETTDNDYNCYGEMSQALDDIQDCEKLSLHMDFVSDYNYICVIEDEL
jgi:hypothetical protein